MSNRIIHESVIQHFIKNQPRIGVFGDRLHGGHFKIIADKTREPVYNLIDDIRDKMHGGGAISGGSAVTAGSLHTGGSLKIDPPDSDRDLYHYALKMHPQKFEMIREISNQLLGAKPSPVWDKIVEDQEKNNLQSEPDEYEKIIDMPNTHSAARLIEAGIGHGKGGGFGKAFRHVARIGTKIYKGLRTGLQIASANKDLIKNLVPEQYQGAFEGFLETATNIDKAVNPIVDAAIDAVKEGASESDKAKLKKLAEEAVDNAVNTHLPGAEKYYKGAKEAYNIYQTGDREKMKEYAIQKGEQALDQYIPQAKPYYDAAKSAYNQYTEAGPKKPIGHKQSNVSMEIPVN